MSEIKPCPFCGAPGKINDNMAHWKYVVCTDDDDCGTCGPGSSDCEAEAIAAWNRRDGGSDGG